MINNMAAPCFASGAAERIFQGGVSLRKTTFPKVAATFVVCYAFWILVTWSLAAQELIAGAVVSAAVALFNVNVAKRAFQRHIPLNSGIV